MSKFEKAVHSIIEDSSAQWEEVRRSYPDGSSDITDTRDDTILAIVAAHEAGIAEAREDIFYGMVGAAWGKEIADKWKNLRDTTNAKPE